MTHQVPAPSDAMRWQALAARDPSALPPFIYGVRTTGVFCRPGCPSRLPNRRNVIFFDSSTAARRSGFRPCKRCRPEAVHPPSPGLAAVLAACRHIEQADEPPVLPALARAVGLSPFYLHRLFRQYLGVTPKAYAVALRSARLPAQLQESPTVTHALHQASFSSTSRFHEAASLALGMTPTQFRSGAHGQAIRYAVAPCRLGWVLVAATDRGLSMIELDDSPDVLRSRLHARFPHATLAADDPDFVSWVARVLAHIEMPSQALDLPLDIQATAFQRQVWEALRAIPRGSTATYAAIAARIGRPTAARAVARACASNPVALAIPCHRVVGRDGSLTGYRWGLDRKHALLESESTQPPSPDES